MKTWTQQEILDLLEKYDRAVEKGIIALWKLQTREEQNTKQVKIKNGVGFNAADAYMLTGFAKRLLFGKGKLTEKQMYHARKRITKYSRQLMEIANSNEKKKNEEKAS